MISCQPVVFGIVHRVYEPAGTRTLPTIRSRSVVNPVAEFAPVRQTVPQGTTGPPKISRPRAEGRWYAIDTLAPPTFARTVSAGESGPSPRPAASRAA